MLPSPTLGRKGFGLVDAMIGLGLISVFVYFLSSSMLHRNKEIRGLRTMNSRDTLLSILEKYVNDTKALTKTLDYLPPKTNSAGNLAFRVCYQGTGGILPAPACAPNCCVTTAADPQPFNLIDPLDPVGTSSLSGTLANTDYAGFNTTLAPARYDANGDNCPTAGPSCFLEVLTSFRANCAPLPSPCNRATTLSVDITIRQAKDGTGALYGTEYTPALKETKSTITIR